jgi:hypothetical protein
VEPRGTGGEDLARRGRATTQRLGRRRRHRHRRRRRRPAQP